MLVKICGITSFGDAELAVQCGASAIGFVFWPESPRFVDPHRAHLIAAMLPPFVTPVGVFVNQPIDHVNEITALVGLGAVQLHGDETQDEAARVKRPVVKAMTLATAERSIDAWPPATMILIDAHDPSRRGGTGTTIDWTAAASIASRRRIMLAGGLTPENVGEAIGRVRPFGIDVSSGVERAPGVKDREKLQALFGAINGADSTRRTR